MKPMTALEKLNVMESEDLTANLRHMTASKRGNRPYAPLPRTLGGGDRRGDLIRKCAFYAPGIH